jgi:hypothetical protein
MKHYYDIFRVFSDLVPNELRRKNNVDWMLPALAGIGVGVAAGVSLGILMAPATGSDTRRHLKEGAIRAKERAFAAAHKAKGQVAEYAQNGADRSFLNEAAPVR